MNEETFVDETPRQQIAGNTAKRDNREPENLGDYKKYTAEADKAEMEREVEVQADKIHLQVVTPDKKYTFISYNDDYVIHCLRYGQPWMTFAKGHKAISSLLHIIDSLTAERDRLKEDIKLFHGKLGKANVEYLDVKHERDALQAELKAKEEAISIALGKFSRIISLECGRLGATDAQSNVKAEAQEARQFIEQALKG
jgi:hypothetical protein